MKKSVRVVVLGAVVGVVSNVQAMYRMGGRAAGGHRAAGVPALDLSLLKQTLTRQAHAVATPASPTVILRAKAAAQEAAEAAFEKFMREQSAHARPTIMCESPRRENIPADLNPVDEFGNTIIHNFVKGFGFAEYGGYYECLALVEQWHKEGCNVLQKNYLGDSPLDVCDPENPGAFGTLLGKIAAQEAEAFDTSAPASRQMTGQSGFSSAVATPQGVVPQSLDSCDESEDESMGYSSGSDSDIE
jgi:hypothetical protein